MNGYDHLKSDRRILGNPEFVDMILRKTGEKFAQKYELKKKGYDLPAIATKVAEIYGVEPIDFLSKGRQRQRVDPRSLYCFWAVRELGVTLTSLARQLDMSPQAVGYTVQRGEAIARRKGYRLIE